MKKVAVVTILSMLVSFATAEVMIVYPKGISKEQIRKHGRARTRAMIHYRTRSLIYGKMSKKKKEELTAVAMGLEKGSVATLKFSLKRKEEKRREKGRKGEKGSGDREKGSREKGSGDSNSITNPFYNSKYCWLRQIQHFCYLMLRIAIYISFIN